jgi:hypothetical protein
LQNPAPSAIRFGRSTDNISAKRSVYALGDVRDGRFNIVEMKLGCGDNGPFVSIAWERLLMDDWLIVTAKSDNLRLQPLVFKAATKAEKDVFHEVVYTGDPAALVAKLARSKVGKDHEVHLEAQTPSDKPSVPFSTDGIAEAWARVTTYCQKP